MTPSIFGEWMKGQALPSMTLVLIILTRMPTIHLRGLMEDLDLAWISMVAMNMFAVLT